MLHDNKVLNPSEFPDSVASGMTIEMSIVLRMASLSGAKKCPRCGHIDNTSISIDDGWSEWGVPPISVILLTINDVECSHHCSGQFQLSENAEIVSPAL
jgi:hypothetical protein